MENKEVSSANNLHSFLRPFGKSLIYIKNKRGPRMEPSNTLARISTQGEYWPFKTTLCFLLDKKSFIILIRSQHTQFGCSLYIVPACQTLSKAFEIPRNNPETSRPILKATKSSCLFQKGKAAQNFLA